MQQCPAMLGAIVRRGRDKTHKTLKSMCNARSWPQKCQERCANGDQRTAKVLVVVGSKVCQVFKFRETTLNNTRDNNFQQAGVQTEGTMLGVVGQRCCIRLHGALSKILS